MSTQPTSLIALRAFLGPRTGLSAGNLGIVGDARHLRGYHLGRDRIFSATGAGWADYSVRTARDKAGLTNHASAMDIGNFPRLRSLSVWLVAQARANKPGTSDIREIIYSPDGRTVLRWDRERGFASAPRTGEADDSHKWHTHISWFRDSLGRDKVTPFRAFFAPAPPPWRVRVPAGDVLVYTVVGGVITGRTAHNTGGFSAACRAPKSYRWGDRSATLVYLIDGSHAGWRISASRYAEEV